MGDLSSTLSPANVGFITAFFAANPVAGFVFGMILLTVIIGVLGRQFRLGERNAAIDRATDAHIARLNTDIDKLDKRLNAMELAVRDRDAKIAEMAGTIKFMTQTLAAQGDDCERLKQENLRLTDLCGRQKGEIQRLEIETVESQRRIAGLTQKLGVVEDELARRARADAANQMRRKSDATTPKKKEAADDDG